eukprot:g30877.t1
MRIDDKETMILFDVTALFISIDIPLARERMTARLEQEQDPSETISTDNLLKLLDLCLTTHFTSNGQTYEQINGTPMGSPISGLLAEAVMQRLERTALPLIQPKRTKIEEAHKLINNTLTGIKFTREEE